MSTGTPIKKRSNSLAIAKSTRFCTQANRRNQYSIQIAAKCPLGSANPSHLRNLVSKSSISQHQKAYAI